MIVTYADDPRVTNVKNLDDTSYQTIVDCASKEVKTLESISVSCGDTACNVWITFNNGMDDFPLWNKVAMDANTTVIIDNHHIKMRYRADLSAGQLLKAKADAGDLITIIAVTIDATPKKDNKSGVGTGPGGAQVNVGLA